MRIECLVVGQLQTNCYLIWDEESNKAIIIDPADDGDYIIQKIRDFQLNPILIANTHGHVDHVLAITELKLAFKIPFFMHQKDLFLLKNMKSSAMYWFEMNEVDPPPEVDKFIREGDEIKFGKEKLEVIETPGHSPGGVSFYSREEGVLFSGDTLFKQGIGRYDFSYASREDLFKSIKKLLKLPSKTIVYSGHGPETVINKEKKVLDFFKVF
ncbi:MAG TPA: MBL fold metallo-hydrolase [Patescibacteria group bacterium]|nr:MBL fold metallo-hydrolase [Patescibacteria group bacterium]